MIQLAMTRVVIAYRQYYWFAVVSERPVVIFTGLFVYLSINQDDLISGVFRVGTAVTKFSPETENVARHIK